MINTNIITQGQRRVELDDPMQAYAKVQQAQALGNQNRLTQLQFDKEQRAIDQQNKLSALLSGQYETPEDREIAVLRSGNMDAYSKLAKDRRDNMKTEAEAGLKNLELASKKIYLAGQTLGYVRNNPTLENANLALDYLGQNGVYNPKELALYKSQVASNPNAIKQFAEQAYTSALDAKDQLAKYETRNLGGTTATIAIDPVTGQAKTVNEVANSQSPDNRASVGASYANAAATREIAKATRDAASIRRDQETEMKLADDYRAQSKSFKEVGDAYKTINATLDKATTSPAATLAGATKFMKLLDPGSVVRESELGMALQATGVLDRAGNYYNTLKLGKVLTPSQAKDFKSITEQIYKAAQEGQKQIDVNYKNQAKTYGLRPEMIVQDMGQNAINPSVMSAIDAEISRRRGAK